MSRDHHPPLRDVTVDTEITPSCCVLDRVYRTVAWQCVDQICYNMILNLGKTGGLGLYWFIVTDEKKQYVLMQYENFLLYVV
jgi:hypothetical protein